MDKRMSLKNFRASDFKNGGSDVLRADSKKDRRVVSQVQEPTPTSTPIIPEGASENDVPSGTVPEILTWVGDDVDRAERALDKEKADKKPRKGLVSQLEEILGTEEDTK